jgi:hypothetical protein
MKVSTSIPFKKELVELTVFFWKKIKVGLIKIVKHWIRLFPIYIDQFKTGVGKKKKPLTIILLDMCKTGPTISLTLIRLSIKYPFLNQD